MKVKTSQRDTGSKLMMNFMYFIKQRIMQSPMEPKEDCIF